MPKNKFQDVIFTIIMATIMVQCYILAHKNLLYLLFQV